MRWWIIQYADGSICRATEVGGQPQNAPVRDITMIAHSNGSIQHSSEYYIFLRSKTQWWGATQDGVLYQLMKDPSDVWAVRKGHNREDAPVGEMRKKLLKGLVSG